MGYLADRFTGYLTRRKAIEFAKTCRPGDTVYSVANLVDWMTPAGPGGRRAVPRYRSWELGRKSRLTGFPKVGHMDVAQLWLQEGPLFRTPPTGLINLFDLDASASADARAEVLRKAVEAR